jgi:5-oxoprolinase (ATP-hydrolysing) subunit A
MRIDINSDLGEGYGRYRCGDDGALLSIVTSANVACGFHAGDPEIMAQTFTVAKKHGVAVGAHAGFPDLWGFGRRPIPFSAGEIERLVAYQIGAAMALASYAGHRITHVNAHGTLGNLSETDKDVADAVARAISAVDRNLAALTIARSEQVRAAERAGLRAFSQIYADRAYTEQGTLVSRSEPGAVIHDATEAAKRVVAMVEAGALITVSGARLATPIDSVCVHGDSPHAIETARTVRQALERAGATVAPFGSS